ncbi:MAG: DUF6442 family protein [Lachnospiraceae bacterium]|jgi:hypothetical protein|nr:DUF6442 family protein [Lachnospiraceae bacterium]
MDINNETTVIFKSVDERRKDKEKIADGTSLLLYIIVFAIFLYKYIVYRKLDSQILAIGFVPTIVEEFYKYKREKTKMQLVIFIAACVMVVGMIVSGV